MKYVTYKQALRLRELGFNDKCIATIDETEFVHIKGTSCIRGSRLYFNEDCPFISQAINWFRKQEIYGYIHTSVASNYPKQCTFTVYNKNFQSYSSPLVYSDYELCEEALLEYLLNNSHQDK